VTIKDFESAPAVSIENLAPAQGYRDLNAAQREAQSMNRWGQIVTAICGPAMIIFFGIGAVWLSGYWPPDKLPGASAQEVLTWYQDHNTSLKLGLIFMTIAYSLMCVYGVGMAVQTRRKEGAFPVWTYIQLTCMACGTAMIILMGAIWAAAAFRADGCSDKNPCLITDSVERLAYAHDVQMMHDLGWMILLGTWMPFTFWCCALGASILLDKTETPAFPRWSGYMSMFVGVSFIPGNCIYFFFEGALGWNGLISMYIPFITFGFWVLYFSYQSFRNCQRGLVHAQDMATA